MIDDTKYQEIVGQLTSAINTLQRKHWCFWWNYEQAKWLVRKQMNFTDGVAKLLARLEEIDRIKDINEVFWENAKKQQWRHYQLSKKAK